MTSLLVLLEDLVVAEFGTRDLNDVRQRLAPFDADTPTVVQGRRFLDALAPVQKKAPRLVYAWAGARLVTKVLQATPAVTSAHTSVRTILLQLNRLVPKVVAELAPDAECPEFWGDLIGGEMVRVGFDGDEEVAWVVEGAICGLAAHFGEQVEITRGIPKSGLQDRRLVDVLTTPKPRTSGRPIYPTPGLSSAGIRG